MELLDCIEDHVSAVARPLFAVTVAAVPCPDTPIILTLHWHGFIKKKLAGGATATLVSHLPIPSSALQLNERWDDLAAVDRAALEAAWELGAWDVQRTEHLGCVRPGAESPEAFECLQAFGALPFGINGADVVVADAPDADGLLDIAAHMGYLLWMFRPVRGGIWGDYAGDATLNHDGGRRPPCPALPAAPFGEGHRKTIYRFGVAASS